MVEIRQLQHEPLPSRVEGVVVWMFRANFTSSCVSTLPSINEICLTVPYFNLFVVLQRHHLKNTLLPFNSTPPVWHVGQWSGLTGHAEYAAFCRGVWSAREVHRSHAWAVTFREWRKKVNHPCARFVGFGKLSEKISVRISVTLICICLPNALLWLVSLFLWQPPFDTSSV